MSKYFDITSTTRILPRERRGGSDLSQQDLTRSKQLRKTHQTGYHVSGWCVLNSTHDVPRIAEKDEEQTPGCRKTSFGLDRHNEGKDLCFMSSFPSSKLIVELKI